MPKGKKIGILTGGGDVPGLNPVIKSVVYRASEMGREVIGFRRGWEALTNMNIINGDDSTYIRQLTRENTRTIDRTGGTTLHTSRTNPRRVVESKLPKHFSAEQIKKLPFDGKYYDLTSVVIENLDRLGIDCLVPIGGDDTLSFASVLSERGVRLVAVPKTMDNDVQGTEYCIGFSTAITRAQELITRARTTLGSHERVGIFRIFGRDAGFTALYAAYVTSARCLIPEYPFELDRIINLLSEDKRNNSSNYSIVVISEGAVWEQINVAEYGEADAYGHRKKVDIGAALAEEVRRRSGEDTMVSDLTYELRGGDPDLVDQMVGIAFGNIAMDLVQDGISGRMVAVQKGCYAHTALASSSAGARRVDVATLYDTKRYRPNYGSKLGGPLLFNRI
jgi:ATP-dependent phosphofructokinase / diphosphate-dependent phosphofructokinase